MKFSSLLEVCNSAREGGYAAPAINVVDENSLRAVVDAAQECKSAVILQLSVKTVRQWGLQQITSAAENASAGVSVPVVLHLDHCPDIDLCKEVIDAGWSSVLMDVSALPDEQVEPVLSEICSYAHERGATVEIEVENILGVEDGVGTDEVLRSCTVDELVDIAKRTGADLLAPQLGTAHGLYKSDPVLQPARAGEFAARTDIPIVLHGGTGLSDEDFAAFIEAGVSKINISTDLKVAYIEAAQRFVTENFDPSCGSIGIDSWKSKEPLALIQAQHDAVRDMAKRYMRIFQSKGRA